MFLVKFGKGSRDPVWPIDIFLPQAGEAQAILGYLLADAIDGFPVTLYPRCLQKAHENAALVDFDFDILQDEIFAADYGVPQRRERLFLVGRRPGIDPIQIRTPSPHQRTVRQALSRLPRIGSRGNSTTCSAVITPAKNPVLRASPFRGSLLFNGSGRPLELDGTAPTLPAAMGGNATPIVDERELYEDEPPWVVSYHARLCAGRAPVRDAPAFLRRITVEEAAALHGFPQRMPWRGSTSARFRQIGNSVPPKLAFRVAEAVAAVLR